MDTGKPGEKILPFMMRHRRMGLKQLLVLLILPLVIMLAGLCFVVMERQSTISEYCHNALFELFPRLQEQQRANAKIERLRTLGATIYYSADPQIRRNARLEAEAISIDSSSYEKNPVCQGINAAANSLRSISQLRDKQSGLQQRIRETRREVRALQWEMMQTLDPPRTPKIFDLFRDVWTFFDSLSFLRTSSPSKDVENTGVQLLGSLKNYSRSLEKEVPSIAHFCTTLGNSLENLLELYKEYWRGEETLHSYWEYFDADLRVLVETQSSTALRDIKGSFQHIRDMAHNAEYVTLQGFFLLCLYALVFFLLGKIFVTNPVLWMTRGLERIRSGRGLLSMPYFFVRELQYLSNELVLFSMQISKITMQSARLETQNQQLEDLSLRDALTDIYNRRYFDLALEQEWESAAARRIPLSMLMIDVDKFKNYNDSYGHVMGDQCLQRIASVFSEAVMRPTDKSTRYGGEEFAILLPGVDARGADKVAARIHAAIRDLGIPHAASEVSPVVTVSIGRATSIPNAQEESTTLVDMADQALYKAKRQGRNRTCAYTDDNNQNEG